MITAYEAHVHYFLLYEPSMCCLFSCYSLIRFGFKYIYIYGSFQSKATFLVTNGKIDFFAEAGRKNICSFTSKEKMFLSDQGTKYLEIHWFPYNSQIFSPKMTPKVGQYSFHAFSTFRKNSQFCAPF